MVEGARPFRRRARTWLVVLAPIAAIAGIFMAFRYSTISTLELRVTPGEVHQLVEELAGGERDVLIDLQPDNAVRRHLAEAPPAERRELERLIAPVVFRAAAAAGGERAKVAPDGRLLSYRLPPPQPPPAEVDEAVALKIAREEVERRLGAAELRFVGSGRRRDERTGTDVRVFTFRREPVDVIVETAGARVVAFEVSPKIAPLGTTWKTAAAAIITLLVLAAIVYIIARSIRRLREQEFPFVRAAIVAGVAFVSIAAVSFVMYDAERINELERGTAAPAGLNLVFQLTFNVVMAALLGIAWGACEADVREAHPAKLASMDALLGGRFSAPSLRASLAMAVTIACYGLLLTGLESFLRTLSGTWVTLTGSELVVLQASAPALVVILVSLSGLPMIIGGLLTVVSITHRRGPSLAAASALFITVFAVSLLATFGNHVPVGWAVVQSAVLTAYLVVPFLIADVLAVIVMTFVAGWAVAAASLIAQPAALYRNSGWALLALLLVMIVAAAVAVFRRRSDLREAEVRPEYARNIAERLTLAAEMTAAQEAQRRVISTRVPAVEGVGLAVRHGSAGAHYFEFFPSAGHVGVAVAAAQTPGLSATLSVSMLKGLLLNYSSRVSDPAEIVERVHRHLTNVFGADVPLSLLFGRLDRTSGAFEYASFGAAPQAVVLEDRVLVYSPEVAPREQIERAIGGGDAETIVDTVSSLAVRRERPETWTAIAMTIPQESRSR